MCKKEKGITIRKPKGKPIKKAIKDDTTPWQHFKRVVKGAMK